MLEFGLVTSLARPEGNTTGVSILRLELDAKRQDILIEAVPGLRLMAVADVNYTKFAKLDALQEAVRVHNVEFSIHRVSKAEEIASAVDSAQASGAKALNILDCQQSTPTAPLLNLVVMSLGPDWLNLGRDCARVVSEIFNGANPGSIPNRL